MSSSPFFSSRIIMLQLRIFLVTAVSRIIALQRSLSSNLQNLSYLTQQRGIKVAGGIKVTNQLTLKQRLSWIIQVGPMLSQMQEEGRTRAESNFIGEELHLPLWGLKTEEETSSQGMWAASGAGKGEEAHSSSESPERTAALPTP